MVSILKSYALNIEFEFTIAHNEKEFQSNAIVDFYDPVSH